MNLIEQKMLDAYFENPPATDWLSVPTPFHPGVLGSQISRSPAWLAMQAIAMMTKAEQDRARLRRAEVRFEDEIEPDMPEKVLDPALPVPRTLTASELPATPVKRRNAKPVRFTPQQFRRKLDPIVLGLTAAERTDKVNHYRTVARMACEGADWDGSLEIAGPKIADQLLFGAEKLLFNVQERLRQTAKEINALARQSMGDEIPRQQLERLEWQQSGYRTQERHFELMFYAYRLERDEIVRTYEKGTGRSWGAYEGIKARAERSARRWKEKNRRRSSLSMVIENMTPAEYARWVEKESRYEPRLQGADAADEDAVEIDAVAYDAPEGTEWGGDDEWTGDGVHRQGNGDGFVIE